MRTRTLVAVAAILLGVFLIVAFCARSSDSGAPQQTVTQADEQDDEAVFAGLDDEDKPDCDTEDKIRNEAPDCGFLHAGRFHQWSWVKAGKKSPPRGWRPGPEQIAVVTSTAPSRATPTAKPAATRTAAPPVATPAAPRPTVAKTAGPTKRTGTTRTTTRRR